MAQYQTWAALAAVAAAVAACDQAEPPKSVEPPVRGLITMTVGEAGETTRRRYPGVIEPQEITSLSFEVGGKLEALALSVGQRVASGRPLASLDAAQFEIEIENRRAAVDEAAALLAQSEDDLARQERLLERGAATRVSVDTARTDMRASRARLRQAEEALNGALEDLENAVLLAPFDGIINSVDADSFATVAAGTPIASIYDATAYEVSFSVNFAVVSALKIGAPAQLRLADDPTRVLDAVVSELGERADTVSSFPVVVALTDADPRIRAGMAVEVSFEFDLPADVGYLIPISAAIPEGDILEDAGPNSPSPVDVYLYDAETETVTRRRVTMAGMKDNRFFVIDGLEPGDRVATAGVAFLREGLKVKLIETGE